MVSPRGRFERCWHRDLYVLLEAWDHWPDRHHWVRVRAPAAFEELLGELDALTCEQRAALRDVRHYMSHRDKKDYWDPGRWRVSDLPPDQMARLMNAFGRCLTQAGGVVDPPSAAHD
jgi:hypothetical protein